jgi:hypothetical protein
MVTPKAKDSRKHEERSPLTHYFERTYDEIKMFQTHQATDALPPLNDGDLETILEDLRTMEIQQQQEEEEADTTRIRARQAQEQLSKYEAEIALLRQEVMKLTAENNDKKIIGLKREEELIQVLKDKDRLGRQSEEKNLENEKKEAVIAHLKDEQKALRAQLQGMEQSYEAELKKLNQQLRDKANEMNELRITIGREREEAKERKSHEDKNRDEDDDLISTEPFIEKINKLKHLNSELQSRHTRELNALSNTHDLEVRELKERLTTTQYELRNGDDATRQLKKKYEGLESELTETIRALNRRELQYSFLSRQHQELLLEKEELNQILGQYSTQQDERSSPGYKMMIAPSQPTLHRGLSSMQLIQDNESVLVLTQQLDLIIKESQRREAEWHSQQHDLSDLLHEWRVKANTAITQAISLEEQVLEMMREKKRLEGELIQDRELILLQQDQLADLQQIVDFLGYEARKTSHDLLIQQHNSFTHHQPRRRSRFLFPIPQGNTPPTRSQDHSFSSSSQSHRPSSSSDVSLSTWSQIISKVNQRRDEDEQRERRIDEAMVAEWMQLQGIQQIVASVSEQSDQRSAQESSGETQFPSHLVLQFVIKILLRLWRKCRGRVECWAPSQGTKVSMAYLSRDENPSSELSSLPVSLPSHHRIAPPSPPSSSDIFDLISSRPPSPAPSSSSLMIPAHESLNLHLVHRTTSGSSIYQSFLSEHQTSSSSRSSFSETHSNDASNPSPLLGEDELSNDGSEESDVDCSFYVSPSVSEGDLTLPHHEEE